MSKTLNGSRLVRTLCIGIALCLAVAATAAQQQLNLAFMISTGAQRTAWATLVEQFGKENPDILVNHLELNEANYKRNFETMLGSGDVDLAFWFAGDRLQQAVDKGLVKPLDDLLSPDQEIGFNPAVLDAVTWSKHRWALPLNYYPWGFFYRRSLFAAHGLTPPTTWEQFESVSEKLKSAGIAPTAVGARSGWPAAAWFDYLDLRLNGLEFHRKLLTGRASFRDARVANLFNVWRKLLLSGGFLPGSATMEWDEVLPYFYRNQVGMVLAGAYAANKMPPKLLEDIDFIPFPTLNDALPRYEDAPLDVLVQSAGGRHGAAARRFVAFMLKPGVLPAFSASSFELAPVRNAPLPADMILRRGKVQLDSAAGIAFFFDRDAIPAIRDAGLDAFRRFLEPPYDAEAAIAALVKASPAH
jgi:multiple sugar transport system substrate-binding protein